MATVSDEIKTNEQLYQYSQYSNKCADINAGYSPQIYAICHPTLIRKCTLHGPISYHQPSSSDYDGLHYFHSDVTFGSGTSSCPIYPTLFYSNHHSLPVNPSFIANSQQLI